MRLKSLSARLLVTSLGWSAFAVLATGLVLVSAFRESVEERFDDTLGVYLAMLIGELAEAGDERFAGLPPDLGEPRFVVPLSGWYWLVEGPDGSILQTSESLAGDRFTIPPDFAPVGAPVPTRLAAQGPSGDPLRVVGRRVSFGDGWYLVAVSGAANTIEADTASFTRRLALYLSVFAAVLVAVTFVQWRVSLRPLNQLGRELRAVQDGRMERVGTDLPHEIAPVAQALNKLIETNRATLERARRHVGNLAHALKTPLSVLLNDAQAADGPLARSVREQGQTMQRHVRVYLDRAQMAAQDRVVGTVCQVGPALERLQRVMARLGARHGIDVVLRMRADVRFAGEQQDLEEIVGNLVDNGLKWASSQVTITVEAPQGRRMPTFERTFQLLIEDDGPGLSEEERSAVISRGARLDQSKPGSGLGLSIVAEIVDLYGGQLILGKADAGGLRVTVELPRA